MATEQDKDGRGNQILANLTNRRQVSQPISDNTGIPYHSTEKRLPFARPILVPAGPGEIYGPIFGHSTINQHDDDLTLQHEGQPQGERIIVSGKITDERNRPVAGTLIEIWQTNAAGRYIHKVDTHDAPLDPNFSGGGRTLTDEEGIYQFTTIKPGAYPWANHTNAWRPAHIHFSLFGHTFVSRIVTQMYFPGDPLLEFDPILQSVSHPQSRNALIAKWDPDITQSGWALGYKFDVVLSGPDRTPIEN